MNYSIIISFFLIIAKSILLCQNKTYDFYFKIKPLQNTPIYFGYHYGENQFVTDTIYLNSNSEGSLKKTNLPHGLYFFAIKSMKYVTFIVSNNKQYKIYTDTTSLLRNLKIENDKENEIFITYQIKLNDYKNTIKQLTKELKTSQDSQKIEKQIEAEKAKWKEFQNKIITDNEGTLSAKIIKGLQTKNFTFDASKFFDNIDFGDERMLFTPVFSNAINNFFSNMPGLTIKNIDSLYKALDYIMINSLKNTSVYEEIAKYLISQFDLTGDYPCPEAFWYLSDKYFLTDLIPFVNDNFKTKLSKYNKKLKSVIISSNFPELSLYNEYDEIVKIPTKTNLLTIIIFWEPGCGHCLDYLRKFKQVISPYNNKVKIYTVLTGYSKDLWKKVIHDEGFNWENLYDKKLLNDFVEELFLYGTPQVFILDKDQKIIAKDLLPEQIIEWIK